MATRIRANSVCLVLAGLVFAGRPIQAGDAPLTTDSNRNFSMAVRYESSAPYRYSQSTSVYNQASLSLRHRLVARLNADVSYQYIEDAALNSSSYDKTSYREHRLVAGIPWEVLGMETCSFSIAPSFLFFESHGWSTGKTVEEGLEYGSTGNDRSLTWGGRLALEFEYFPSGAVPFSLGAASGLEYRREATRSKSHNYTLYTDGSGRPNETQSSESTMTEKRLENYNAFLILRYYLY